MGAKLILTLSLVGMIVACGRSNHSSTRSANGGALGATAQSDGRPSCEGMPIDSVPASAKLDGSTGFAAWTGMDPVHKVNCLAMFYKVPAGKHADADDLSGTIAMDAPDGSYTVSLDFSEATAKDGDKSRHDGQVEAFAIPLPSHMLAPDFTLTAHAKADGSTHHLALSLNN